MKAAEIKKKYPKAWILLKEWFGYKKDMTVSMELSKIFMPERKLYDFFDEQEIYVLLFQKCGLFNWIIENHSAQEIAEQKEMTEVLSRRKSEEKAFEKAFEILEDKL